MVTNELTETEDSGGVDELSIESRAKEALEVLAQHKLDRQNACSLEINEALKTHNCELTPPGLMFGPDGEIRLIGSFGVRARE